MTYFESERQERADMDAFEKWWDAVGLVKRDFGEYSHKCAFRAGLRAAAEIGLRMAMKPHCPEDIRRAILAEADK